MATALTWGKFNRQVWGVLLRHQHLATKGLAVSPRTLRRRLHEAGYRWKRPRYVYVERAPHLAQKKDLMGQGPPDW
ncbi:winged helix-turn-helix domain-containing protein [Microvirga ossetica]|uniref:winged helix-turn-helix domain-containing protein n=1 Tax=Microvirga ossetica TaxID=1882682 RepID=UPI0030035F00